MICPYKKTISTVTITIGNPFLRFSSFKYFTPNSSYVYVYNTTLDIFTKEKESYYALSYSVSYNHETAIVPYPVCTPATATSDSTLILS